MNKTQRAELILPELNITDPKTVALGCTRVSTEGQDDRWGRQRQVRDINDAAAEYGLTIIGFIDETVSGADEYRVTHSKYYDLAKRYPGINLIFAHPSRVGRHVDKSVGLVRKLLKLGAVVWVGDIGNLRKRGNWSIFVRAAADVEVDYHNIVHQMHEGKQDKARAGGWAQGPPPFGYRIRRDERGKSLDLEPDPDRVAVYHRLRTEYRRHGATTIAINLNTEGVPSPQGKLWNDKTIRQILRNPAYTGTFTLNRGKPDAIDIPIPALITPEEYRELQRLLADRVNYQPGRKADPDLLTGHVVCAVCKQSINSKKSTRSGKAIYHYACSNAARGRINEAAGRTRCPNNRYHNMQNLERKCWAALVHQLTDPDLLAQLFEEHAEAPPDHSEEIKRLEDQLVQLYDLLTQPGRVTTAVQRKVDDVEDRLAFLQQAALPRSAPNIDLIRFAEELKPHLESTGKQARRELLVALRVRFFVSRDGLERLEITVPRA